jgi:hypothetical protein
MAEWTKHELRKIAKTDDLHIAPFRDDGVTYGTPTWIWSVRLATLFMSARTTEPHPAGIRPRCGEKRVASPPQV